MSKRRVGTLCGLLFGANVMTCASAVVTYNDSTFLNSNWGLDTFQSGGTGGTASAGQTASGNPGTGRRHTLTTGGSGSTIHAFSRYGTTQSVGRYEPAVLGAIATVSFSMDFAFLSGSTPPQEQIITFALKQGSNIYAAQPVTVMSGTQVGVWQSIASGPLTQNDFVLVSGSGSMHPVFSTAGTPIRFGWLSSATNSGAGSSTSEVAFDNWSATILQVPGPGSLALAACGACLVTRRRRACTRGQVG